MSQVNERHTRQQSRISISADKEAIMKRILRGLILGAAILLVLGSCGHSSRQAAPSLPTETSQKAAASYPEWLVDALKELESMPCPMNVSPQVFTRLKARLREDLIARAGDKVTSAISQQWTKVRELRWEQPSPDGPVYLTWGYVQGGDYDQNATVEIADITPIAQNYGKSWNHFGVVPDNPDEEGGAYSLEEYYSMTAVCDGSIDGVVRLKDPLTDLPGYIDDIDVLAQSFSYSIAGYRILGNTTPNEGTAEVVKTIAYGDHEDIADPPHAMRLSYRVDASDVEFDKYAYYWVRPYDMETAPPLEPNYGSYSDSDDDLEEEEPDYDPANLQPAAPEVPQAVNGRIYGACESELTLAYVPGENTPLPLTGQTWNFGGAAQGSQSSSVAMPTITLTSTAGNYNATVKVANAYGESGTAGFTIVVTTNDHPPAAGRTPRPAGGREESQKSIVKALTATSD
jgi:hypothetical protein